MPSTVFFSCVYAMSDDLPVSLAIAFKQSNVFDSNGGVITLLDDKPDKQWVTDQMCGQDYFFFAAAMKKV